MRYVKTALFAALVLAFGIADAQGQTNASSPIKAQAIGKITVTQVRKADGQTDRSYFLAVTEAKSLDRQRTIPDLAGKTIALSGSLTNAMRLNNRDVTIQGMLTPGGEMLQVNSMKENPRVPAARKPAPAPEPTPPDQDPPGTPPDSTAPNPPAQDPPAPAPNPEPPQETPEQTPPN